jgi:transposase InsO family protein
MWEVPRSILIERRMTKPSPRKRGPKPAVPDEVLIPMIREDLTTSPFREEGHRKVYYRLKHERRIKVAAKRVLPLMREHALLSPQRMPKGEAKAHDGSICAEKPNEIWGTDAILAQTVEEGTVWVFAAVEHWNAECLGIHALKEGNRFEAMEPVKQGLRRHFGGVAKGISAGLTLRSDHGSQYTSEHFQTELRHLGIRQSFAYIGEPETNGVIERF